MMFEIKMPVTIYRGDDWIASGELLPNGAALAVTINGCDGEGFDLFDNAIDTKIVEEKIPMKFFSEGVEVAEGELVQSGGNICLCPSADTSFELMDPEGNAMLFLQLDGWAARLEIKHGH